jgi:hypothetical protein
MFLVWLAIYCVCGGAILKVVADVNAVFKGTYFKRKGKQFLWKQATKHVRKRK